jgi:hypothetical protein
MCRTDFVGLADFEFVAHLVVVDIANLQDFALRKYKYQFLTLFLCHGVVVILFKVSIEVSFQVCECKVLGLSVKWK